MTVFVWKETLARRVFPHPGGPASSTPDGALSPRALNCSGDRTGACRGHKKTPLFSSGPTFYIRSIEVMNRSKVHNVISGPAHCCTPKKPVYSL